MATVCCTGGHFLATVLATGVVLFPGPAKLFVLQVMQQGAANQATVDHFHLALHPGSFQVSCRDRVWVSGKLLAEVQYYNELHSNNE